MIPPWTRNIDERASIFQGAFTFERNYTSAVARCVLTGCARVDPHELAFAGEGLCTDSVWVGRACVVEFGSAADQGLGHGCGLPDGRKV